MRSVGDRSTWSIGSREIHARAYVASFGFKGSDQQKKVGEISGGERNRVQLAKVLAQRGATFCCWTSRPTTWTSTRCALWRTRCCVSRAAPWSISHDRWFLDRIATHVLAFEDDAVVRWFEGNFSDYEADRHKRLGTDADQPHRLCYKPITRA